MLELGYKIKELRAEKGITQEELAKTLNLSVSTISMYEINKILPSPSVLLDIAKFFNISLDELFGYEPQ
jgi:transcriptional regulator, XRE family